MNILIVDDDAVIKKWLSMLLMQLDTYEKTIFEASDGIEALDICQKHYIDLVISDIVMPRMNGLELLQELKSSMPHTRMAVLSSYDDFEYVRKALKMGALDYIPKADITIEDISALLEKTIRNFNIEHMLSSTPVLKDDTYDAQRNAFQAYLDNPNSEAFIFADEKDPAISASDLCITIFKLQKQALNSYTDAVLNICESLLKSENLLGTCFPWQEGLYVLIYQCSSPIGEYQQEEFLRLFTTIDKEVEKYICCPLGLCINVFCRKGKQIRELFFQGVDALLKKEYYDLPQIPALDSATTPNSISLRKEWLKMLEQLLDREEYGTALQRFKTYIDDCHQKLMAPFMVKKNCSAALYVLIANALFISTHDRVLRNLDGMDNKLKAVKNRQQMDTWVSELCEKYLIGVNANSRRLSAPIRAAIVYINENYHHKVLLHDISKAVFMNHTYLSQQFKKEVGISIPKYLEQVRINKALILIRANDYSISEVAERVGFSNQNYFSKIFKEVTGCSPIKYKKGDEERHVIQIE